MNKSRVLLVEDRPALAVVYQEYLASLPYELLHLDNGQETMSSIKCNAPDVLLLDLSLPDIDVMDILHFIKENQVPSDVVIMSEQSLADIAVEAVRYGAFDFIIKPFDAKRLQVTIDNALRYRELGQIVETFRKQCEHVRPLWIVEKEAIEQAIVFCDGSIPKAAALLVSAC